MRLLVAVILCSHVLLASPVSGEHNFPYKISVAADDVYVRSGPGQNYYPTDKLRRGQEVEVYRHDPGGWCADSARRRQFFLGFRPVLEADRQQSGRGHRGWRVGPGRQPF